MARVANQSRLILTAYRWSRIATFTTFYVAQGIPIGVFTVAMPIYLAHAGYSLAELSYYGGVIGLPWAFKLIVGPFMDRFTYFAMGFRRPWVILTQTCLLLTLFAFTLISLDGDPNLFWITTFGFLCNVFAASQDVATDGMAIDILHEDERGRANAFMGFGQTMGFSVFGAISGYLFENASIAEAAAVATVSIGLILGIAIVTRERVGEKMLPWTEGSAVEVEHRRDPSFFSILRELLKVLFLPMSLVLILMELLNRMRDGVALSVIPKYAEEVLHIPTDDYTYFVGIIGIVSAVVGVIFGPMIDRFGPKRFLFIALMAGAILHVVAWYCSDEGFGLTTMGTVYVFLSCVGQIIFVTTIAIFMTICWKRVSATQFAIYMSLANLSRTLGAYLFALVAARLTFELDFLLMAVLLFLSAIVVSFFDPDSHQETLDQLDRQMG